MDEANPHREGRSVLLSLLIQMLISSKKTLPNTPRIMFHQICGPWALSPPFPQPPPPPNPVQLTHKINIPSAAWDTIILVFNGI